MRSQGKKWRTGVIKFFPAIICPWFDVDLPPPCSQVLWCHWGEIELFSAMLAQDGLAEFDQPRKILWNTPSLNLSRQLATIMKKITVRYIELMPYLVQNSWWALNILKAAYARIYSSMPMYFPSAELHEYCNTDTRSEHISQWWF